MAEDLRDFLQKQGISIDAIKRVIINYKKLSKANVTLTKTRSRLADLQKYWEKLQSLHARIRRAATAEDRKKLPYFLQDEFLAAKDAYNKAADYLQEAIANFVMPERSICDLNTDSALRDFADTLATITDNSRNESRSLADRIPVPKYIYCTGSHGLEDCEKFLLSSVEQRSTFARVMQVCLNCLWSDHFATKCPSKSRCVHCRRMHHSLLHLAVSEIADVQVTLTDVSRALDVLRAIAWTLRPTRPCTDLQIHRFGKNYTGHARSKVVFGLTPCNQSKPLFPLTAYICKNLLLYTASVVRPPEWWPHLRGLPLEDPHPTNGEPIHLLVGADLRGSLLLSDRRRVDVGSCTEFEAHVSHCVFACGADSLLREFWADERISAEITKPTVHCLLSKDDPLKIRGLSWLPLKDFFCFVIAQSMMTTSTQCCHSSPNSTTHWDGPRLSSLTQRSCSKSSGCSRTIGMSQFRKN
ncbi:hypothetical protein HN011_008228 [Eciton burchellii]|nr:hypothetical protein HN011_008228 [Eciton burchellii]